MKEEPKLKKEDFEIIAFIDGGAHAMVLSDKQRQAVVNSLVSLGEDITVCKESLEIIQRIK